MAAFLAGLFALAAFLAGLLALVAFFPAFLATLGALGAATFFAAARAKQKLEIFVVGNLPPWWLP